MRKADIPNAEFFLAGEATSRGERQPSGLLLSARSSIHLPSPAIIFV